MFDMFLDEPDRKLALYPKVKILALPTSGSCGNHRLGQK
jgi:hypothetical protein